MTREVYEVGTKMIIPRKYKIAIVDINDKPELEITMSGESMIEVADRMLKQNGYEKGKRYKFLVTDVLTGCAQSFTRVHR